MCYVGPESGLPPQPLCELCFLAGPELMDELRSADPDVIEGWVDECAQGIVRGWERRPNAPQDPVTVEIPVDGIGVGA